MRTADLALAPLMHFFRNSFRMCTNLPTFFQVKFTFAAGKFAAGVKYKFVAYATTVVGEGPGSAPYTFNTAGTAPSAPSIDSVAEVAGVLTVTITPPSSSGSSRALLGWCRGVAAFLLVRVHSTD